MCSFTVSLRTTWLPALGFAAGFAALVVLLLHLFAGPFAPQATGGSALVEFGGEVTDALVRKVRGEAPPPPVPVARDLDDWMWIGGLICAAAGLALSLLSFALQHSPRIAAAGTIVSAAAILTVWVWWIGIVVLVILCLHLLGQVFGGAIGGIFGGFG